MASKYKRVLIKLSGEAISTENGTGIDFGKLAVISKTIKKVHDRNIEIAIVVGGGNFWRGEGKDTMNRSRADHMGMLATVMNALAVQSVLEAEGMEAVVQTAIEMRQIAEPFVQSVADKHLSCGRVVIFGCGTGNPFFSTDTTTVLRAAEINAEAILMAKNIDYVYEEDPKKNPDAKPIKHITFTEMLKKADKIKVIDYTAMAFCLKQNFPLHIFALKDPDNILKVLDGEEIGTVVSN